MEPNLTVTVPVARQFPRLSVYSFVVEDLDIASQSSELESFKEETLSEFRAENSLEGLADDSPFGAYREFFWDLGIDPTKTRPAAEALARRSLQGNSLPTINTFVDAYNLASLTTKVPLAAFDRDSLGPELELRFAEEGESFLGIGMDEPTRLDGGELVIEDNGSLVAVYPYRDSEDTKITGATTASLVLVCGAPGVSDTTLRTASERAREYVERFCDGETVDVA